MWLVMVTGHVLSDFVLQSGFVEERRGGRLVRHALVVALATAVCLELFGAAGLAKLWVVGLAAAAGVVHGAQDRLLPRLLMAVKVPPLARLGVDQALHGLVLWGLAAMAMPHAVNPVAAGRGAAGAAALAGFPVEDVMWSVLFIALGTGATAVVIAHLLEPYRVAMSRQGGPDGEADDALLPKAGLWIGLCERFLLISAIAWGTDVVAAVGLLLGVKSVYRFRELDRRVKAEYYLLGTLLSVTAAVVCGVALRWALTAEPLAL